MDARGAVACDLALHIETTITARAADIGDLEGHAHSGGDGVSHLDICSPDSHDYSFLYNPTLA